MRTLFRNAHIVSPGREIVNGAMLIADDRIAGIFPDGILKIPADRIVDLQGKTLLPGFFDIHFHGRNDSQSRI